MKKYLYPVIYTVATITIGTFLLTILYFFNITSDKVNSILTYLVGIIAIFIGSFKLGSILKQKGIISGLIYFFLFFVVMFLTSLLIFNSKLGFNSFIYYIVLLLFSIFGGILGKNKQEEEADIN